MDFALRPPHKPLCLCVSVLKRLQFGEAVYPYLSKKEDLEWAGFVLEYPTT